MARRKIQFLGFLLAGVVAVLVGQETPCLAREGFYLGAGFAGQSAGGDLDGTTTFTDTAGNQYLIGSVGAGTGSAILIGYGFTRFIGVELLGAGSQHAASHTGVSDTTAQVSSGMLDLRFTAPIAQSFEFFARVGTAGYSVDYANYVKLAPGLTSTTNEHLSGFGSAYGGGFEIIGEHAGLEFGYLVHAATFTSATASGQSGTFSLPRHLSVPLTTTTLIVSYHFK